MGFSVQRIFGRWRWLLGVSALLAYAIFLGRHFSPVAGGSDSSGYANSARLLRQGRIETVVRTVPELALESAYDFVPLGFRPRPHGRLVPSYPIGLPLHLAAAAVCVDWPAAMLAVAVGAALSSIALTYVVGRRFGASRWSAALAAGVLAVSPMFLFSSVQPLSDTLATSWCLAAVYCAVRAQARWGWSVATGVAAAIAVLVRPSNAVLLPAIALLLWAPRKLAGAFLGGAPWALLLGVYQKTLYGSALESGYGSIFGAFHLQCFWPTIQHFGHWLLRLAPLAVLAPLAALGPAAAGDARGCPAAGRSRVALAAWAAGFIVFYAFYDVSGEAWHCLRFIQPAFPALLILGALGLDAVLARIAGGRRLELVVGMALAAALALNARAWTRTLVPLEIKPQERMYLDASEWVRANVPRDALVCCMLFSGTLYFYTDLPILRWDSASADHAVRYLEKLRLTGRPLFALAHAVETEDPRMKNITGRWEKLAAFGDAGIWRIWLTPVKDGK